LRFEIQQIQDSRSRTGDPGQEIQGDPGDPVQTKQLPLRCLVDSSILKLLEKKKGLLPSL
jgi:hypothetical protein